jgi:prepilin-type N-terminal cleavage/methylation domain-containing protein
MRRTRGFTLLETIVAMGVFSILLASLFLIYTMGANAWMKSDTNSELLGKVQVLTSRVSRSVARSSFLSLNVHSAGDAVSFLSPVNDAGEFQYDPFLNRPLWQEYLFIYRDAANGQIREASRSVVGQPAETVPLRIRGADDTRIANLSRFLRDGKLLVDGSASLQFRILPLAVADRIGGRERLEMVVVVEQDVRGQTAPRRIESRTVMKFRN